MRHATRFFRYVGPEMLTRGDYGVRVVGGHSHPDDRGGIYIFDPDFGDQFWINANVGIKSGEWVEITAEEHAAL